MDRKEIIVKCAKATIKKYEGMIDEVRNFEPKTQFNTAESCAYCEEFYNKVEGLDGSLSPQTCVGCPMASKERVAGCMDNPVCERIGDLWEQLEEDEKLSQEDADELIAHIEERILFHRGMIKVHSE